MTEDQTLSESITTPPEQPNPLSVSVPPSPPSTPLGPTQVAAPSNAPGALEPEPEHAVALADLTVRIQCLEEKLYEVSKLVHSVAGMSHPA
jgi:hypothetical protein